MRRLLAMLLGLMLIPLHALAGYPPEIPWGDLAECKAALPENARLPVYTGPGEAYLRAAEGRAAVSTAGWVQTFCTEDGWTLVHYEVAEGRYRFGWVEGAYAPAADFIRARATLSRAAEVTDDPLGQRDAVAMLPEGEAVTWLGVLGDSWVYVEAQAAGTPVRGFVLRDRVALEEPEKVYADCLYPIRVDGLWGYIDYQGQVCIEPQFAWAGAFRGAGYAEVMLPLPGVPLEDTWALDAPEGIIDKQGQWVLGPSREFYLDSGYDSYLYGGMDTGIIWAMTEGRRMGFFNLRNGFFSGFLYSDWVAPWAASSNTPICVPQGDRSLFVDRADGTVLASFQGYYNANALQYHEGFCVVPMGDDEDEDGTAPGIVIDLKNRPLALPEGYSAEVDTSFSEGLLPVRDEETQLYGFVDRAGKLAIPASFLFVGWEGFSEGLCAAYDPDTRLWGYIDPSGAWAIAPAWRDAEAFRNGTATVKIEDELAIINRRGEVLAKDIHSYLTTMSDYGVMLLSLAEGVAVMADDGRMLLDVSAGYGRPVRDDVLVDEDFAEGLQAVMGPNGLMGYVDTQGQLAIPCQWQEAEPFRHGLACVTTDSGMAYIDHSGRVVWQEHPAD